MHIAGYTRPSLLYMYIGKHRGSEAMDQQEAQRGRKSSTTEINKKRDVLPNFHLRFHFPRSVLNVHRKTYTKYTKDKKIYMYKVQYSNVIRKKLSLQRAKFVCKSLLWKDRSIKKLRKMIYIHSTYVFNSNTSTLY